VEFQLADIVLEARDRPACGPCGVWVEAAGVARVTVQETSATLRLPESTGRLHQANPRGDQLLELAGVTNRRA
jgi:hypothetical protein